MATKQVIIPDVGPVTIYKRRGNRSLRLSIGGNGEVRVSIPYWLPYMAGEKFAASKALWIIANKSKEHAKPLEEGVAIGKAHRLHYVPSYLAKKVSTRVDDNEIRVTFPRGLEWDAGEVQSATRKACIRALREEAERLLPGRLRNLAERNGFSYKSVGVKQLKSRWGSCDSSQNIVLNLFLMQLPWQLIDYVLVHELIHTKVMQHGAPFWGLFERHLPGARGLRQEIGRYQPILTPARGQLQAETDL